MSDVTLNMKLNKIEVHKRNCEPWRVNLVDTCENSKTGGRLKRVKEFFSNEKEFSKLIKLILLRIYKHTDELLKN